MVSTIEPSSNFTARLAWPRSILRGRGEADQDGAVAVSARRPGLAGRGAGSVVEMIVDGDGDLDGSILHRAAVGAERADSRLHLVAWAVAGTVEVELLVEARLLIAVDEELPLDGGKAAEIVAEGEGVFATGRLGFEGELAGADALERLAVRALDLDGVVFAFLANQAVAAAKKRAEGSGWSRQRIVKAEGFGRGLEGGAFECERAEADHLARLVHGLVGGQVAEIGRRREADIPLEGDRGAINSALAAGGDDHSEVVIGRKGQGLRQADAVGALSQRGDGQVVGGRFRGVDWPGGGAYA
jgi:hypothetical protein